MYFISFKFNDGHYEEFEHITKVEYATVANQVSVSGDDIFNHKFPLDYNMHLFSEKANYLLSHKGIARIDIEKE